MNFCIDTYGLRVTVIVLAGHPLWRSKVGLEDGGPIAFMYVLILRGANIIMSVSDSDLYLFIYDCSPQHKFVPVGEYREPKSVIEEYGTAITTV